ncbi:GNAT superfamily N-acetyltransferase [Nocardioides thalensis]|uniref:GNAT superfamily N-acetyltransferase n=1 Tax=Nocardioides thalensis TaxID=1914755 RepID=A0A853BY24_9ACTN|nr:GNAT family N-acetyltransferase [Nocardioides thalensis]NYI99746.1 GNAT superfamily N-acetyltransferase [Nocardioides thalensis]
MDTTRTPLASTPGLTLCPVRYSHPDAVALVARVQGEYVERYGSPDESPIEESYFDPPSGLFLVGYVDGVPVATGAWKQSPVRALGGASGAEIKRMYVVPEQRGRGLSRVVLAELERTAAAAGHDLLVLETGLKQPEAIALYESSGYVPVPAFGHYCGSELSRTFGKRIGG